MKRRHWKSKLVSFGLSIIMLFEFTPKGLLTVIAEEIGELVENVQVSQDTSDISYTLTDIGNLGTADIIQENVNHRTLTSKEYLMSDDIIMVRQFSKPIHYYENGQYIDIGDKSLQLDTEIAATASDNIQEENLENFDSANVFEGVETIVQDGLISAGKIENEQKSDVFLNFKLPTMQSHYQLLGAKVRFEYKTLGAELFNGKDYSYNVYIAETQKSLEDIVYVEKPDIMQTLEGINHNSQKKEKTFTYESEMINIHNIEDGIITLGIESTDQLSEGSYISIPTNVNDSMETIAFYQIVSGLKDEYSLETYEVDDATAYINNATGDLTVSCDLLSVETLADIPFESYLIYNSNYDNILNELGKTSSTGKNVKLNFQQYMISDGDVYYYLDADGSVSNFYSLGNGEYYSKEKKLYYTPHATIAGKGTVRDLLGNQMLFENGCLTKIISSASANDYIKIDYLNNTDKITKVSYYSGESTPKYEMRFDYNTLGQLWKATTWSGSTEYAKSIITYNENGYLTDISNHTGRADTENGVSRISLEYVEFYITEPQVYLTEIWSNQDNGLELSYVPGENLTVQKCRGRTNQVEHRVLSKTVVCFFGKRTELVYFENNKETGRKNIAFNNKQKVISEWVKDASGLVSVNSKTNWLNSEDQVNDYTEGTCSYFREYDNNKNLYLGAKGQDSIVFASPFEEVEDSGAYTFAFNFKAVGYIGLDFSVTIGDKDPINIKTENSVETYVSLPCDSWVGEIEVKIKNNDSNPDNTLRIDDFNCSVVNYTAQNYVYNSAIKAHKLQTTKSNIQNGTSVNATYDDAQRVVVSETQSAADTTTLETTTYTYLTSGIWKDNVSKIVTKDKDGKETEVIEYAYNGTKDAYEITQTTTKGKLKQYTAQEKDTVNDELIKFYYRDENGEEYSEYYALLAGDFRLQKIEYYNTKEEYSYNNLGQLISLSVYDTSTNANMYSQTDLYDENGVYIGSSCNGNDFVYEYDNTGMISSIDYKSPSDSQTGSMLSYTYNTYTLLYGANQVSQKTYANMQRESYTYQNNKTVVVHRDAAYNISAQYTYQYDAGGDLRSQSKTETNGYLGLQYTYNNDIYQPQLVISGGDFTFGLNYETEIDKYTNQIKKSTLSSAGPCSSGQTFTSLYTYDAKGRLESSTFGNCTNTISYDTLSRVTSYDVRHNGRNVRTSNYQYAMNGEYSTNRLTGISNISQYDSTNSTASYYQNGYVKSVSYGNMESEYEYDALGRLTREENNGVAKNYTYDANNNILLPGLTYTNGKLTSVNGAPIIYDELGNPTTYKGNTFTWQQGRKLAGGTLNGKSFSYSYDGNGMRYQKYVNGEETEYYYNGTQLLMEKRPGQDGRIYYIYDASGVAGIVVGSVYYYFDKNTLGDIVAIRNELGMIVAQYEYDAWGNHTVTNQNGNVNASKDFIGNINPFRYRGYYYDTETGFYYLQTRYYDPTICRFINADNYELVATLSIVPGQLNMYAYCNNNPIMYTDETGEAFFTSLLIGILIGAAIGGAIGGVSAGIQGEDVVGGILSGALVGGVLGAATIMGGATALAIGGKGVAGFVTVSTFASKGALLASTIGITAATSFVAGIGSYAIETNFNNRQFSWSDAIRTGGNTALKGLTNYGLGMALGAGGAYNYLLNGAPRRTVGKMISDGVRNGLASNVLKLIQTPWYYLF